MIIIKQDLGFAFLQVKRNDYEAIAKLLIKAFKAAPWNEEWDYYQAL